MSTPFYSQSIGPENVPQGKPDDGQDFAQYAHPGQAPVPVPQSAPQPERRKVVTHSGKVESTVVTVREELPRGGFLYHDFLVEHSGFGHYRVANTDADQPYYTNMEDVKDAIRNAKFVGQVTFGTMDPDKGWIPE